MVDQVEEEIARIGYLYQIPAKRLKFSVEVRDLSFVMELEEELLQDSSAVAVSRIAGKILDQLKVGGLVAP